MDALYEIEGHFLALDKVIFIGPITSPFKAVFLFKVILAGATAPHISAGHEKQRVESIRAGLVAAYNRYNRHQAAPCPQEEARTTVGEDTLTIGELCHLKRFRAGLTLAEVGALAWPDFKAAHQKLRKIETGAQIPTGEELARLAEALKAPELAPG
jgi:hypothetical protein